MVFAMKDTISLLYQNHVTVALQTWKLKCLPPPLAFERTFGPVSRGAAERGTAVGARRMTVEL